VSERRAVPGRIGQCLILLFVALALGAAIPASGQDLGAGISLTSAEIAAFETDRRFGYPAVSLDDLGRTGLADVRGRAGVVTAMAGGAMLELYVGSPFYRLGRTVGQLPNPPYHADGTYWIPAALISGPAERRVAMAEPGPRDGTAAASPATPGPARALRVVIDPGHGGRDPGTIGRRGTREKDVVLTIAKLVHAKLGAMEGIDPMLTRDRDVLIPLQRRSQLAVAQQADLFVSIHANASKDRKAQGFETYFLGEARTELSREVAMRENSAVQYEEEGEAPRPEDLQFILARLNLTSFQRESSSLGGHVQNALRTVLRTPDRGVKQNVFWVLVGSTSSMPSILVEIGFLSNEQEEKLLRSEAGQQRVAQAIVQAIAAYRDDYAPRLHAAGAR
jgi:N-acetylmuramoyl-L-alanine amidase